MKEQLSKIHESAKAELAELSSIQELEISEFRFLVRKAN